MKRIEIIVERTKDLFTAYSNNCEGIYGAGNTLDEVKEDVRTSIGQIKKEIPEERWPNEIKGEYEVVFKLDTESFLEYYASFLSLAGLERITGVNQKQLSNYLHHRSTPREAQKERINIGFHKFAQEMLNVTL